MLPTELLLIIYDFSSIDTRIKLNRIFKWSFYIKNPYENAFKGFFQRAERSRLKPKPIYGSIGGHTIRLRSFWCSHRYLA